MSMHPINITYKNYRFSPRLLPTLLVCLLLPILLGLGFWQIDRANQKRILITQYQRHGQSPPMTFTALKQAIKDKALTKLRYYRIQLEGHYDNTHRIFLDNRMFKHRVGYHVLTPFIVEYRKDKASKTRKKAEKKTALVLVNRGWVPAGYSRKLLPDVLDIKGKQIILGQLYVTPGKAFLLNSDFEFRPSNTVIIEALQFKALAQWLKQPLYPFALLLDPKAPGGFVRDWHPVLRMTPQRHMGYAFQWFALAGTLLLIFFSVNFHVLPKTNGDNDNNDKHAAKKS